MRVSPVAWRSRVAPVWRSLDKLTDTDREHIHQLYEIVHQS